MSAPNAAGAGLTSPTPLSPSWLVRRSALLRSPDCASVSPEPVKAAVATSAAAASATAAVVSDDRFLRNVILLSSLRHWSPEREWFGLFSPFGYRRRYTTRPKSGDRKVREVRVAQPELRDRRSAESLVSARCARTSAGWCRQPPQRPRAGQHRAGFVSGGDRLGSPRGSPSQVCRDPRSV